LEEPVFPYSSVWTLGYFVEIAFLQKSPKTETINFSQSVLASV